MTPDDHPIRVATCDAFKIYDFSVNIHLYTSQRIVVDRHNKYFMYTTQHDATYKDSTR
jgi:hypothetical protein